MAARSRTRVSDRDFERAVALKARTEAIARHFTDFLKKTDRFAKTIVFCVDQEHADAMRRELNNFNVIWSSNIPIMSVESPPTRAPFGNGHLSRFQELETISPGNPDDLATAHDRRRCADVQEHRARTAGQLDDGV